MKDFVEVQWLTRQKLQTTTLTHRSTYPHIHHSFSNLDRSRSIWEFIVKSDLLRCTWEKSDLATPIWAASVVCLLVKEGVVCSALCRWEQDDHAHYDQKDLCVLFHRTGSISTDKSGPVWKIEKLTKANRHENWGMHTLFWSILNICSKFH